MKTRRLTVTALFAALFLLTLPVSTDAAEEATTTFDRWYVLETSGQRAGYMHMTERRKGERIVTQSDMKLTVRRGEATITIEHEMWFIETVDGRPVEASSTIKPGAMAIVQQMTFNEDGVELTTGQGAAARTTTVPLPDPSFHPPAAGQRIIEKAITAGAKEVSIGLIDVSMGVNPITMSAKVIGEEAVDVFGKTVPAIVWEATVSSMPGITVREYVDLQGRAVKSSVQIMPGMDITMIEADEKLAKAKIDPPRIMAQTLIQPDRPIENPRQTRRAIYRVTVNGDPGGVPIDLPRSGYQRVVWDNRSAAAAVVDLDEPVNAVDDLPTDADLAASDMINHEDEAVRRLLGEALPGDAEELADREAATRLRAFVNGYIDEKDLSVGLAKAGQVARTAQGDCTEHAVLLAALLRARGIPARTVTGLIYVDEFLGQRGVFGYHMWAQAWLVEGPDGGPAGGRWVDLDGVLPDRDFDAAHITLAVSSMADGQMINDMVEMLPTFGRLQIEVTEAE
jgi:hypothetical protein